MWERLRPVGQGVNQLKGTVLGRRLTSLGTRFVSPSKDKDKDPDRAKARSRERGPSVSVLSRAVGS